MSGARHGATFELSELRVSLVYARGIRVERRPVATGPGDVAPLLAQIIGDGMGRGRLVAAPVDAQDRVIGLTLVALGNGTDLDVRPADVYRPLILAGATRFYLGRCDASGAPCPAEHDFALARRLADLSAALGIELSDLLILGAGGAYHSLREHGQAVAAWRDEAHERALQADPNLARRAARLQAANNRQRPAPSLTRADALRAALWACRKCHRRQTQRAPVCRYCGAAQVVH